jgi:TctA family transporter
MSMLENLAIGLQTALSPEALLFCAIGVTVGTFVGVLPGVGALAAISLALPMTFYLDPGLALIMLAGIFYGTQYGGSTASILLNLPGSPSSAVAALDGNPMAKQGRAGVALFATTIASFVGSSLAILVVIGFAPLIADLALTFSSVEYFSVMLLALVAASALSPGSPLKGVAMMLAGLAVGLTGVDVNSGQERFTFGMIDLYDGFSLVAVAMGLFGISEILSNMASPQGRVTVRPADLTWRSMMPTRAEWRGNVWPVVRGAGLGTVVGIMPGTGPTIATFMSYALERRVSRHPERFGTGAMEGLTGPEAANNASVQAAFIPTLSLGIPGDAVMAVMLGVMMIHGISPGPGFVSGQPEMFWGLIMSFWVGNLLLLVLNIPLIGVWVRILSIPYSVLYPAILVFICIGVFSVNNSVADILMVLGFGILGYLMRRTGYPPAPLLLGFILGPLMEEHFRRALLLARGDFAVFVERPVSLGFLVLALVLLLSSARKMLKPGQRRAA